MLNPFVTTRIVITQCCAYVLGTYYHPAIKMISRAPSGSTLILIVVIVVILVIVIIIIIIIITGIIII